MFFGYLFQTAKLANAAAANVCIAAGSYNQTQNSFIQIGQSNTFKLQQVFVYQLIKLIFFLNLQCWLKLLSLPSFHWTTNIKGTSVINKHQFWMSSVPRSTVVSSCIYINTGRFACTLCSVLYKHVSLFVQCCQPPNDRQMDCIIH